jgi:hypothetical protein
MSTSRKRTRSNNNDTFMQIPDFFVIKQVRGETLFENGSSVQYKGIRNKDTVARLFYKSIQRNMELFDSKSGVYTWILKKIDGITAFIASRVISNQELGTLHINLDKLTQNGVVLGAGELLLGVDKDIYFNVSSGTFMAKKKETDISKIVETVKDYFEELGANIQFLVCDTDISDIVDRINEKSEYGYMVKSNGFEVEQCKLPNETVTGYQILERYKIISRMENKNIFNSYLTVRGGGCGGTRRKKRVTKRRH